MIWKGHTSDYDVADIKRERSTSDYAVSEISGKCHFFLRFCMRKRSKIYVYLLFIHHVDTVNTPLQNTPDLMELMLIQSIQLN